MTSLNRVILTGKVVTPPRRHYRPDGAPVLQFPLELNDSENSAVNSTTLHGAGRKGRERITIVAIGKLAEFNIDLLQIGQPLIVVGRLNQRSWQTPEGRNRTLTEVIATDLRTIEAGEQTQKSKKEGE